MIREIAVENWFDGKYICRGVPFSLKFTKKDFPVLDRIAKGIAEPKEFWNLLWGQKKELGHEGRKNARLVRTRRVRLRGRYNGF